MRRMATALLIRGRRSRESAADRSSNGDFSKDEFDGERLSDRFRVMELFVA